MTTIVRLCEKKYDATELHDVVVVEMEFKDGGVPSAEQINPFYRLVEGGAKVLVCATT